MSYPMTYDRVIRRNGLETGDYEDVPTDLRIGVNLNFHSPVTNDDVTELLRPEWISRLQRYETWVALLVGDLRRLERDVQDEGAICDAIYRRTGVDRDVVAAVLKAFMEV